VSPIGRRGKPIRVQRAGLTATDAEWEAILARAQACKTPPGRYIREASIRSPKVMRAEAILLRELVRELGRSGTALAQLAATARETGALPAAATLETALAELLTAVRGLGAARGRQASADDRGRA
jgi:hypothetical protein